MTEDCFDYKALSFVGSKGSAPKELVISVSCNDTQTKQENGILIDIKDESAKPQIYILFLLTSNTTPSKCDFQTTLTHNFPFKKREVDELVPSDITNTIDRTFETIHKGCVIAGCGSNPFKLDPRGTTLAGPRRYYFGLVLLDEEKHKKIYVSKEIFDFNNSKANSKKRNDAGNKESKRAKEKKTSKKRKSAETTTKKEKKPQNKEKKENGMVETDLSPTETEQSSNVVQEIKHEDNAIDHDVVHNDDTNLSDQIVSDLFVKGVKLDQTKRKKKCGVVGYELCDKTISLIKEIYDIDEFHNKKLHNQDSIKHISSFAFASAKLVSGYDLNGTTNLFNSLYMSIKKLLERGTDERAIFERFSDFIKLESVHAIGMCKRKHPPMYDMASDIASINEIIRLQKNCKK